MTKAELVANLESKLRPAIMNLLPPHLAVRMYSSGRQRFLEMLKKEIPDQQIASNGLERKMWGITFRSPIMNAAGMFKNGECYEMAAMQGAGAYLAGTVTLEERAGNRGLPFVPYPNSGAASNFLGLPNLGANAVAEKLKLIRRNDCPLGISLMDAPNLDYSAIGLTLMIDFFRDSGVDFIEINESCPNTGHLASDNEVYRRLQSLQKTQGNGKKKIPIVVKFSTDTPLHQVPQIMDMLFSLGYDGVNFGNTSTRYDELVSSMSDNDLGLFFYFTQKFKGGVSGRPLKEKSLKLVETAARYLRQGAPKQEFHVWRTGGVEDAKDLRESEQAGASMSQWFTGYWEAFSKYGHDLYKELYKNL